MEYTDIYQPLRMHLLWPLYGGSIGFYTVRLVASLINRRLSQWQALLAAVTGIMAGVVLQIIARNWTGSDISWLAFTVGLAFSVVVLLGNAMVAMLAAGGNDPHGC